MKSRPRPATLITRLHYASDEPAGGASQHPMSCSSWTSRLAISSRIAPLSHSRVVSTSVGEHALLCSLRSCFSRSHAPGGSSRSSRPPLVEYPLLAFNVLLQHAVLDTGFVRHVGLLPLLMLLE